MAHTKESNEFYESKVALEDSAAAVLVINSDDIKCVSFSTSGEKDKSVKPPTFRNKIKALEVNAELSKHALSSVRLTVLGFEESNRNGEACRASSDKTGIRKSETENDGCDAGYVPTETSRIMRNVIMIGIAFMVHFTSFCGTSNLQSSINADRGLGTVSLMSIFISMMISTIFLPVVVIRWLGCKWTMAVSLICYIPYIVAQGYACFYTLIPSGFLDGLGAGPLWCAKCVYLNVAAEIYSKISGVPVKRVLARFFGIFFMFYELSDVWGNLISSAVFSVGKAHLNTTVHLGEVCGVTFCPGSESLANTNLERPPDGKIWTVALIYLGCIILAFLIITYGVDSLKRYNEAGRVGSGTGVSGVQLLLLTFKLLKDPKQLLLLPITAWLGVGQVFRGSEFTVAYVSCAWGISNIGYVMIIYGVTHSITAILAGYNMKLTGRLCTVCSATVLQIGVIVTLLVWRPEPGDLMIFFSIAGVWGTVDAVWLVQINALCGMLFPGNEEVAYSNYRVWRSMGFISAYAYSPYLCISTKIYILLALLFIGISGYIVTAWGEMKETKDEKNKKPITK